MRLDLQIAQFHKVKIDVLGFLNRIAEGGFKSINPALSDLQLASVRAGDATQFHEDLRSNLTHLLTQILHLWMVLTQPARVIRLLNRHIVEALTQGGNDAVCQRIGNSGILDVLTVIENAVDLVELGLRFVTSNARLDELRSQRVGRLSGESGAAARLINNIVLDLVGFDGLIGKQRAST